MHECGQLEGARNTMVCCPVAQSKEDSAQLQRISHQLSGLMSSLADVEKLALALQADASASRKVLPQHTSHMPQCMLACVSTVSGFPRVFL